MFSTKLLITRWFRAIFSSFLVVNLLIAYPPPTLAGNGFVEFFSSLFGQRRRNLRGTPEGRPKGGGGRGDCSILASTGTEKKLTALIPAIKPSELMLSLYSSYSKTLQSSPKSSTDPVWIWSDTIEEKPTLWFYIPYQYSEQSQLKYAKLALVDQDKNLITKPPLIFNLPEKPGIAQVKLPISLDVNKPYKWYFSVICNENKPSRNPTVTGWIQRVPREKSVFALESSQVTFTQSYYANYAKFGLWYDAFTRLVRVYQPIKSQNKNLSSYSGNYANALETIQTDWREFFKALQWSDDEQENNQIANEIANSPILELQYVQTQDSNVSYQSKL